ncbi:hypothetical protein PN466_02080 [Roseofilum reptotaenium CS-1145]|uniref:Uncharacterized protein n=1 Tax=Roseofilum reptotaenium AO1-A TaxID=1925591 RepID=A0A1L9QN76_9CYAN|nr:hypothetical protein [Roseofilum reptotaenium]MDB9515745.1 hypothetical protein [Roseofilum reptotaenium CS-1145]OJJ24086.1 hypothetical protein BI308_18610 [Roseofilum reptotaenium AO1-A]
MTTTTHQRRITPITGLSDEDKRLLRKIGEGNLSRGVRLACAVLREAQSQGLIRGSFDDGYIPLLNGVKCDPTPLRSRGDEPKKPTLPESPKGLNPYLGKYLTKQQLRETGHFTERMIRAFHERTYKQDSKGFWWRRVDPFKCFTNARGQVMATYLGLADEQDVEDYPFLNSRWL